MLKVLLLTSTITTSEAANVRQKRGALSDDADRIIKQGSTVDVTNVGQLINLVERNKAEECLARVICELSNNPQKHGDEGNRFARSLLKFRQDKHPKVKKYTDAMQAGAKSKNIEQCHGLYPKCGHHTTGEVISVGNRILRS